MLIDAAFWLLHHFFDGHVREVLRVEHEAVVLIELGEAEARLVVRIQLCQLLMGFHLYDVTGVEIQENGDG